MFTFLVKMFPPVSEVFVHFRLVIRVDVLQVLVRSLKNITNCVVIAYVWFLH